MTSATSARLTPEARAILEAKLPESAKEQRKGAGGKWFTYASIDYLTSVLDRVDPDWSDTQVVTPVNAYGVGSVTIVMTVLGVSRSASSFFLVPKEIRTWDYEKREWKTRPATSDDAKMLGGNSEAAARRRVCAKFGLGRELWAKGDEADAALGEEPAADTPQIKAPRGSGNGRATQPSTQPTGPSEAQAKFLVNLGVSQAEVDVYPPLPRKTPTGDGRGSPLSLLIDDLKAHQRDQDYDPDALVRTHLRKAGLPVTIPQRMQIIEEDDFDPDE